MKSPKKLRLAIFLILIVIVGVQLVPVTRDNPPVTADFNDPLDVKQILKKSCYDCHSNETVWPWYSHVAPSSWLVASDVHEARDHLCFSDWGQMSPDDQRAAKRAIWKQVSAGEMPPGEYLLMHSDATLTAPDTAIIHQWVGEVPAVRSEARAN